MREINPEYLSKAKEIALEWSQGKNVRVKHVGEPLTDLIASALQQVADEMRAKTIEVCAKIADESFVHCVGCYDINPESCGNEVTEAILNSKFSTEEH